jgi:mono/diheme cytochrome c family protein
MAELSHEEAEAIYAYLRTVPKLHNPKVPTPPDPPLADTSPGSQIYHRYGCQTCHGESGVAYGDLRPAKLKYPTNEALIAFLKDPAATIPRTRMPRWNGVIKEEEYAPLCDYVRKLSP